MHIFDFFSREFWWFASQRDTATNQTDKQELTTVYHKNKQLVIAQKGYFVF